MAFIETFLKRYEKEYDFYKELSGMANILLEDEISNRGIKAIISHRAKRPDRLKEKLLKRTAEKKYKSKIAIEKDIIDLAGVRVALYFPSDRKIIEKVIEGLFDVIERKDFPEDPQKPKLNKRFSGYWASHYRVKLKKREEIDARFTDTLFEIQTASVLMHAWAEVEHDLAYKPLSGNLSEDELAILDEINGLVIAGEIALERLQKAITQRTQKKKDITDKYELSTLIYNTIKATNYYKDFGTTFYLNNYLDSVNKIKTSDFFDALKNINLNLNETISDQVLNNIIAKGDSKNVRKYLNSITQDKSKVSAFELFIKTWVLFEKVVSTLNLQNSIKTKENFIPHFSILLKYGITQREINKLNELRKLRNKLLHGYESIADETLKNAYEMLKGVLSKSISRITDPKTKDILAKEFEQLT